MTTYILILHIVSSLGSSSAVAEFKDQPSCISARSAVIAQMSSGARTISAVCVAK